MLAVIYGFKQIAEDGLGWAPLLPIVAGLAVGVVFVRRQRRLADPLIDLRLFRDAGVQRRARRRTCSAFFAAFGTFLFIAQYLQLVLGLSPLEAGLWTLPSSLGFVVGSMLTARLVRRDPARGRDGGRAAARRGRLRGADARPTRLGRDRRGLGRVLARAVARSHAWPPT